MVKYWCTYINNDGSRTTAGYRSLEGFVTDIIGWVNDEHKDPEEKLYIYEEHNKDEGFYVIQEGISH